MERGKVGLRVVRGGEECHHSRGEMVDNENTIILSKCRRIAWLCAYSTFRYVSTVGVSYNSCRVKSTAMHKASEMMKDE